jgi:hypothetical protein
MTKRLLLLAATLLPTWSLTAQAPLTDAVTACRRRAAGGDDDAARTAAR